MARKNTSAPANCRYSVGIQPPRSAPSDVWPHNSTTAEPASPRASAIGQYVLADEELLQSEAALPETFGVLDAYVAVVPGFELVAGLVFAGRIGEDEAVPGGVVL